MVSWRTDSNPVFQVIDNEIVKGEWTVTDRPRCFGARHRTGFSLVELSVVVIIIGVLAAFGIPRMLKSVERSKAAEAFKYSAAVRAAQERYQAREGT